MSIQQTYQILQDKQKQTTQIVIAILLMVLSTVGLDFLFSQFQNNSFYISESLLFSSFWILFFPLLHIQSSLAKKTKRLSHSLGIVGLIMVTHLLIYPALVWILSKTFYYHTFSYWQTFNFGLSAYFIKTVIVYGFSLIFFTILNKEFNQPQITNEVKEDTDQQNFISSILISDNNKTFVLEVNDVLYFLANSPYVNIYHPSKKYLHTGTLKSLEAQLNNQFVRIHKSHIVNLNNVISYQSRQNGDYDLTLSDDTILRVSRNYAKKFKSKFEEHHRLTTK